MVEQVLDTEALQPSRADFLATHHPIRMYRAGSVAGAIPTEYGEREFLRDFLKPKDYAFAAVLGEAGTGKSHLIRWLELNIPSTDRRHVLLIPKIGTNLRGVISRILALEGMEGPKFDEYRRRLEDGRQSISEGEARERLLDNLAIAVGPNQPRDHELSQVEAYLTRSVPDFLRDPVLRRHLLSDGSRVHELTEHALGRSDRAERAEKPKEFAIADLPLHVSDLKDVSVHARNFHARLFGDEELLLATLKWINGNVGTALRQLINFSGENLSELLLDVRETLAERRVELVVLVEDFAKLQGIDRQLLESFLVRTHQEGRRPLCALRTALAVTTGYFDRLEDTVKTRIKFRVVMDVAAAESGGLVTPQDLERFSARYLNAARLSESGLQSWYEERKDGSEEPVPSACDGCPHRARCHAAFGESDGYGLYPFNANAIQRMARRASSTRFNPRTIINRVLKDTLEKYTEHIRQGEFPPAALQKQFGRSLLSAAVINELQRRDPADFQRRQVLIDLWTDGTAVTDLPDGVHEAFVLPKLGVTASAQPLAPVTTATTDGAQPARTPEPTLPPAVAQLLKQIDDWHNGVPLPQRSAQNLRVAVYRAVVEHIDWDAHLLVRKAFAGTGGTLFQQRYVAFPNQELRERTGNFQLTIPTTHADLNAAALALQGLVLYQHHGCWHFKDGAHLRRAYARQLEVWSRSVLDEVQRPTRSGASWDPVPAAVELLAIGAKLHGRPTARNATLADHLEGLFGDWSKLKDETERSAPWRDLAQAFRRRRKDLLRAVLYRAAGTKGGSTRVQIIDSAQVRPALNRFLQSWRPQAEVAADARAEYEFLSELRSRVGVALESATDAERERLLRWDDKVAALFGDASRGEVLSAIKELLTAADRVVGLAAGTRAELDGALEGLPAGAFDRARQAMQRVREAADFPDRFAEVGRDYGEVLGAVERFLSATTRLLDLTEQRVGFEEDRVLGGGGDHVESVTKEIEQRLRSLEDELAGRGGEVA